MIFCFQKHFVLLELGLFCDDVLTFDGAFCGGFWPNVDSTIVVRLLTSRVEVAFQFFWPQRLHLLLSLEPLAFRHDGGACTGHRGNSASAVAFKFNKVYITSSINISLVCGVSCFPSTSI